MKVVITLKSGLIIELPIETMDELEEIHQAMNSFGKFFAWHKRIWVRKKEVASYEVVKAPLKSDETI